MTLPEDEDGDVDRLEVEPADIETAADAARFLGIPPSSTDEEIELAKRELVMQLHPDQGGTEGAFKSLETSEDLLKEYPGGDMDDAEDYRRWEVDGPWKPGTQGFEAVNNNESGRYVTETGKTDTSRTDTDTETGPGFGVDRSDFYSAEYERYRETAEDVKLTFIEEVRGVDLSGYDDVEEAIDGGAITEADVNLVESALQEAYGVENLTLDDIAGVIASLVVTGAVSLGMEGFFTERSGAFSGGGTSSFKGGGGAFRSGNGGGAFRGGSGTGPFG
jgi:hypothetical protein